MIIAAATALGSLGDIVSFDPSELEDARSDRSGHVSAAPPLAGILNPGKVF